MVLRCSFVQSAWGPALASSRGAGAQDVLVVGDQNPYFQLLPNSLISPCCLLLSCADYHQ